MNDDRPRTQDQPGSQHQSESNQQNLLRITSSPSSLGRYTKQSVLTCGQSSEHCYHGTNTSTQRHDVETVVLATVIDALGVELQIIENIRTEDRYLWHEDNTFWVRQSVIVLRIERSGEGGNFKMDGREYALTQHGGAENKEFSHSENNSDNEESEAGRPMKNPWPNIPESSHGR